MGYDCIICNQYIEYKYLKEVDFLYDDNLYYGKPICKNCKKLVITNSHLNYKPERKKPKPIGIEKFL